MSLRTQKVSTTIERVVGEYLAKTYGGGNVAISIVQIELSADLKHAQLWLSVLGEDAKKLEDELTANTIAMQRAVAAALQTKFSPKLQLHFNDGLEYAARISKLLKS